MGEKKETSKSTTPESNQISIPSVSLPKGGGAIRGIGEKLETNLLTGTASLTVPIYASPGRSGFGPKLSLSYNSSSGNGPFGFGWSLSLPSITRKTDRGLPRYHDELIQDEEEDVFILAGSEDLIPVYTKGSDGNWALDSNGNYIIYEDVRIGYKVRQYRPRVESIFATIERWTRISDGDIHWRSISKDNILTIFGKDEESRIYDRADKRSRVFSWLISQSFDDKGNAITYEYIRENENGIDVSLIFERNRKRPTNRYLKRILYGNRQPLLLDTAMTASFRKPYTNPIDTSKADWMFEIVFDYGDDYYKALPFVTSISHSSQHQLVQASTSIKNALPNGPVFWPVRPDAFSTFRPGFEVRTYRRCQRVMMFHNFQELGNESCLVRSTEFDYSDFDYSNNFTVQKELEHKGSTRFASFIYSITQSGYTRDSSKLLQDIRIGDETIKSYTYIKKSLPPLEFEYSKAKIQENKIISIDAESLDNIPYGIDGNTYQFVDLNGEGISGILSEHSGHWYYKPNLSRGKFGPLQSVTLKPSLANLSKSDQQLLDLTGDGNLDLVDMHGPIKGYYERRSDKAWENFVPFDSFPSIALKDPYVKLIDLTGDGHADILITEDQVFRWYPSLAEKGFGDSVKTLQALDEERGPRIVFGDGTQSIYLADMSGDGLSDIVRIRNGEICYWPNLGYGNFGEKVTMDNSPTFDTFDQFDQKRIRLADIDGSGVTDIVYLHSAGIRIYFNQSGNMWSNSYHLSSFPHIDNSSSVQVADLLGNGTACLVWSSQLPGESRRSMRYVDLMGQKPNLLTSIKNNLGAETRIIYSSSTKFYLADKIQQKPWITRLPFPVPVVERKITFDHIGRNCFVKRYAYHHGYYDGTEREFRGFGMVEEWDTEEIDSIVMSTYSYLETNWEPQSYVPPVLTRTWFHTGYYYQAEKISKLFAEEYYHGSDHGSEQGEGKLDFQSTLLPDTILETYMSADVSLSPQEAREACRSLKGSVLHQEVFSLDRDKDGNLTEESARPYTVSERNYIVKRMQPRGKNPYGVFLINPRETIDYQYERKLFHVSINSHDEKRADPRIKHRIIIKTDEFGNILKSMEINYGRQYSDPSLSAIDQQTQNRTHMTYVENHYTSVSQTDDAYRGPLLSEMLTFEVVKLKPLDSSGSIYRFSFNELQSLVEKSQFLQGDWDIPYSDIEHLQATSDHPYRRLIEDIRIQYRSNKLDLLLPVGKADVLALQGETYKLAFTKDLLVDVYRFIREGQQPEILLPSDPHLILSSKNPNGCGYVDLDGAKKKWWVPSGRIFYSPNPSDDPSHELDYASKHFFLPHRFCDPFDKNSYVTYDSNETVPEKNNDLLIVETRDAIDNTVSVQNNYRVLQPELVTDPNGSVSDALFDALGLVVATSIHKDSEGDSTANVKADLTHDEIDSFLSNPRSDAISKIGAASSYIVYDLNSYYKTHDPNKPPYSASILREEHASEVAAADTRVQINFLYSDGFGREIQKKNQAEPGKVNGIEVTTRWIGSGWTIFNNKGKPVRKFEPFFDDSHKFKFGRNEGVSSTLFYDPLQRVVTTLHPNHTYEKIVFDPWHQKMYDANDTCLLDPPEDTDIQGYMKNYFKSQPSTWQTWYDKRKTGIYGNSPEQKLAEKDAADKAAEHNNTPTLGYFDSLGRAFLTISDNGTDELDNPIRYRTLIEFDIEGNECGVTDAKDRVIMRYHYDMLSNRVYQNSVDAGEQWTLKDVTGNPVHQWKSAAKSESGPIKFETEYDALRRPSCNFVEGYDPAQPSRKILFDFIVYGEKHPDAKKFNLRGKEFIHCDMAGVVRSERFDFKGNLEHVTRILAKNYKTAFTWSPVADALPSDEINTIVLSSIDSALAQLVEIESFSSKTKFDALNRPIQFVEPHSNETGTTIHVVQQEYNEANMLEKVHVWLEETSEPQMLLDHLTGTDYVKKVDYNAKGQRTVMEFGNNVVTEYSYDPETFRLIHLETTRKGSSFTDDCPNPQNSNWPGCNIQNLHYFYDPAGNITSIRDYAQQKVFFKGIYVNPENHYKYDPIYRLVEATGREHIGLASSPDITWDDRGRAGLAHPHDGKQLRRYQEVYVYDEVGNILSIDHKIRKSHNWATEWTRRHNYFTKNNHLKSVIKPNGTIYHYEHDLRGNMTVMGDFGPHVNLEDQDLWWDFEDRLERIDLRGGGTVYYVYDGRGQRVRKVHKHNGAITEERIYLQTFEIFRKSSVRGVLERESVHIMANNDRVALVEIRTANSLNDDLPSMLVRYEYGNHLGSACIELDKEADPISYEEYYPCGNTSFQEVRNQNYISKRYRYTGKERDEESGLYYHGARYYAPWLGRWISPDPAGLVDGSNMYRYSLDNPLRFTDPHGLQAEADFSSLNTVVAGLNESWRLKLKLEMFDPPSVPAAPQGTDHALAEAQARIQYRIENSMPAGTNVQHWMKWRVGRDVLLPPEITNSNLSPLQSDRNLPATTMLLDPSGGPTRYEVLSGEISRSQAGDIERITGTNVTQRAHEHTLADRTIFGDELSRANPNANPRNAVVEAGQMTRWRMTGEPGRGVWSYFKSRAASFAGSLVKGIAGSFKQSVKSLIPGIEAYDYAKYVVAGGASVLSKAFWGSNVRAIIAGVKLTWAGLTAEVAAGMGATAAVTAGAAVAAAGSVALLGKTIQAALEGTETPIEVADKYYGTHFASIF